MQPLIDGDILLYEVGFGAETSWQNGIPPWEHVAEKLDMLINNICTSVGATAPPIIYLTGTNNFRDQIATRQPYKDRPGLKPWHYNNLKAYLRGKYDAHTQEGLEADDLMAIFQSEREELSRITCCSERPSTQTIICTRDKDLRAVPGWHYGWEVHNQPQFGPALVEEFGTLQLSNDRKSIKGTGLLFFYSQCITGDRTDSILGIEKVGVVGAFEILNGSVDSLDAFKRTREAYRAAYGDMGDTYLLETGRLLWMTRELDEKGSPKLWEFPSEE